MSSATTAVGKIYDEEDNTRYAEIDYWDQRYAEEDAYDWLGDYNVLRPLLNKHVRKEDKILIVGCGNSQLSRQMWDDNYRNIWNSDLSKVCVDKQRNLHEKDGYNGLNWLVLDACNMSGVVEDNAFDVVIEKATLDVFMVKERSPWPSDHAPETLERLDRCLKEISRVLRNQGGRFLSITWTQPHFRIPVLSKPHYGWTVHKEKFSSFLEYFCFVMTKNTTVS